MSLIPLGNVNDLSDIELASTAHSVVLSHSKVCYVLSFDCAHHGLLEEQFPRTNSEEQLLPAAKTSFGISVLTGLVVAGTLGALLDIAEIPVGSVVGAFVGGFVATLLLCAGRKRAMITGFIVGLFSFPVELAVLMVVVTANLYTPPQAPEISVDVMLVALVATLIVQIVGGIVGGLLGGALRHPPPGAEEVPSLNAIPYTPRLLRPEKYCIQCGAGLASGILVCHACGAKQPA